MKLFSRSVVFIIMLVLSLCVLPQLASAQPGDPGGDPDAPIDGGMGVLIVVGVVYGFKKIRDERKKKLNNLL